MMPLCTARRRVWPALLLVLGAAQATPPSASAAADPDIQAIIEALMPGAARATRNLVVRQRVDAPATAASAPDTSAVAAPVAPDPAALAAAPVVSPPSLALAIEFEPNSAHVRPESGPVLGSLVAAMQSPALKGSRFLIEGHADARGAAAQNQRLSQARAEEVRLYLVALGVHPARLRAVGRGSSAPVNPDDPAAAENRRVRVVTVE